MNKEKEFKQFLCDNVTGGDNSCALFTNENDEYFFVEKHKVNDDWIFLINGHFYFDHLQDFYGHQWKKIYARIK